MSDFDDDMPPLEEAPDDDLPSLQGAPGVETAASSQDPSCRQENIRRELEQRGLEHFPLPYAKWWQDISEMLALREGAAPSDGK